MMKLHPEYLRKNGRPEFVVLPYKEFVQIQEQLDDAQDVRALRSAIKKQRKSPTKTLAQVKRLLALDARND